MSTNHVLQSFDPLATHPFTRYCTPPNTPTRQQSMSPATTSPAAHHHVSSHTKPAASSPLPPRSIFVPYMRQSPEPPELEQILKKKDTSLPSSSLRSLNAAPASHIITEA
ncbi:hypothetical protein CPB85DRAFT_1428806 [Mucidula mucida]|nr:hypothetical protein CPB85DRAFT_1428806 [Mucidula mucida]